MKWYIKTLLFIAVIITLSFILIYFFPEYLQTISVISMLTTIVSGLILFYTKDKENLMSQLLWIIKEHERYKKHSQKEISSIKKDLVVEKSRSKKLSKMVDNIGLTLNKENISKQELINNISSPLKAILFMKTWEDRDNNRKLFINKVYPNIHAYRIRSGFNIIPPRHVPQDKSNEKIINWFFKEVEKVLPKNYEYNIPIATVVNLSDIKSFKRLKPKHEKGHFDWLSNVPPEDIAPTEQIIDYLETKKDISTRDIIEIPNIRFLIDENYLSTEDTVMLKNKENFIIGDIKKYLNTEKLKTTDLSNIDEKELTLIFTDYGIKNPLNLSKIVKNNAEIWKLLLDRRFK